MLKIYHRTSKDKDIEILTIFKPHSWVLVEDPTTFEIDFLIKTFGLDQKLLNDAIDWYEVPRIDVEEKNLYIFTRFAYIEEGNGQNLATAPLLIIIGSDFIVTISPRSFSRLDDMFVGKKNLLTNQKSKFMVQILSLIHDSFHVHLNLISKKVRSITVQLEKVRNRDIMQFVTYENVLNDFNLALVRLNNNFTNILTGKYIDLTSHEKDAIQDLSLDNAQLIHFCNENLRTIINIREAYSTIMTNTLNRVIKLFTSATVILTVPTIIGSFYGMNVKLPGADSPFAFYDIVVVTTIICLVVFIVFLWKDWL